MTTAQRTTRWFRPLDLLVQGSNAALAFGVALALDKLAHARAYLCLHCGFAALACLIARQQLFSPEVQRSD